ncbi:MAG TPA: hypothetical protein VH916_00520 [Dehalococcoidia bacterium]|jgi:hypothetical protein
MVTAATKQAQTLLPEAEPVSLVSFTFLSNAMCEEPWHTQRLDRISTIAHSASI